VAPSIQSPPPKPVNKPPPPPPASTSGGGTSTSASGGKPTTSDTPSFGAGFSLSPSKSSMTNGVGDKSGESNKPLSMGGGAAATIQGSSSGGGGGGGGDKDGAKSSFGFGNALGSSLPPTTTGANATTEKKDVKDKSSFGFGNAFGTSLGAAPDQTNKEQDIATKDTKAPATTTAAAAASTTTGFPSSSSSSSTSNTAFGASLGASPNKSVGFGSTGFGATTNLASSSAKKTESSASAAASTPDAMKQEIASIITKFNPDNVSSVQKFFNK
jgi:hypothetical protein